MALRRLSVLAASLIDRRSASASFSCILSLNSQENGTHNGVTSQSLTASSCIAPWKLQNLVSCGASTLHRDLARASSARISTQAVSTSEKGTEMAFQSVPEPDISYLTQKEAAAIDEELMGPLGFSVDQLMVRRRAYPQGRCIQHLSLSHE